MTITISNWSTRMTWDTHKWEGKDRISQGEMPLKKNKV